MQIKAYDRDAVFKRGNVAVRESLPLSVVIDQLEANSEARDRAFVRGLSLWLSERASHLELQLVRNLGLRNVLVTFQMKNYVKLIVTGSPGDRSPGTVTVTVDEADFPHVLVLLSEGPVETPYEFCTMDYSLSDQRVQITEGIHCGQTGDLVVAATIGKKHQYRIRLASGDVVTVEGAAVTHLG